MARRERTSKKSRRRRVPHKQPKSIEDVIATADYAMEAMDVSRALSLYSSAAIQLRIKIDSKEDVDDDREKLSAVLGKLGELKVSQGDQEGARRDFSDAIALLTVNGDSQAEPDDGNEQSIQKYETRGALYLYLGQLSSDNEAFVAYKKGTEDLERCLRRREALVSQSKANEEMVDDEDDDENIEGVVQETRRQLCGAYCSLAELYLTDLCFDENAENQCELFVNDALKLVDSTDGKPWVDALQAAASLRLSQQRGEEAAQNILSAYRKMESGCRALADLVGLGPSNENKEEKAVELLEVDAANNLPGFEFRCQTAKILLESAVALKACDEMKHHCVEAAVQVLGSLLAENDEVVEIWYLTGCAFAATDPPNTELAEYYWKRALEMLHKIKEDFSEEARQVEGIAEEGDRFQSKIQEVSRQMSEIATKLEQLNSSDDVWPMEDEE